MDWSKLTTYLQLTGAALAIPAAAGGAYSVYQNYFTHDLACQKLRTAIVATMERNVSADVKRTLLRRDVTEFVKTCGDADPDAKVLFEAALQDTKFASVPASPSGASSNAVASAVPGITPDGLPASIVISFGRSPTGDVRGWVALTRGETDRIGEPNFDGHELSLTVVPPFGTILRARHVMPVWTEPQSSTNDSSKLQGRVLAASCVRIISTRISEGRGRNWGEVAPALCTPTLRANGPQPTQIATIWTGDRIPPEGFATGPSGERKGWVALALRKAESANVNFDGFVITESTLPPTGTLLTARWSLPIWNEVQGRAPDNLGRAQGRLVGRSCVRVVSARVGADRLWAEVEPAAC